MSAGEIEKAESRDRSRLPRQYTEEYRLEAAGHCRKAHESDPKKSIRECAAELGTSDRTLNDRILKQAKTGRATQERTDGQKEPDAAKKRIREPGSEQAGLLQMGEGGRQQRGSVGSPQGGHHRDMGREREAVRLPEGLVEAHGRSQVRRIRRHDTLPRAEMHVRAGDTGHLPQCLEEDHRALCRPRSSWAT